MFYRLPPESERIRMKYKKLKRSFEQSDLFMPESNWLEPSDLPDLSQARVVAFDTETRDDGLLDKTKKRGPGWFMGTSTSNYMLGLSVAWHGGSIYVPLWHLRETANWPYETVGRWLATLFRQDHTEFVGHNISYDLGWIYAQWQIPPPARLNDTGALAAFLVENLPSYKLNDLCRWRGIPGKDETMLVEACKSLGLKGPTGENLWRLPGKYVGPYAERDAGATLELYDILRPLVEAEGSWGAYTTEMELIPMTLRMRRRGIRVDLDKADQLKADLIQQRDELVTAASRSCGSQLDMKVIRSAWALSKVFDGVGIKYSWTSGGETRGQAQPQFEGPWMKNHRHELPRLIQRIRTLDAAAEKFVEDYIFNTHYNGRVHASINQFRNEDGGTRSHRFSYDHPPLQQMPSRDDELAPRIRSIFLPEEGTRWYAVDYSQQEFRLIVHVAETMATLSDAALDKLRTEIIAHIPPGQRHQSLRELVKTAITTGDEYRRNPDVDFHSWVAEITRLERRRAKDVNFAKAFGAGVGQFAAMTGMDYEEAKATMNTYDERLPFVSGVANIIIWMASERGTIRLIDGARSHYPGFEGSFWYKKDKDEYGRTFRGEAERLYGNISDAFKPAASREEAQARIDDPHHPWQKPVRHSFTYKGFNHLIQGSAARQMKTAMRDIGRAGYLPMLQMHDELGFSFDNPDSARKCAKLMIDAIPLVIPMKVDVEFGPSWGEAKEKLGEK